MSYPFDLPKSMPVIYDLWFLTRNNYVIFVWWPLIDVCVLTFKSYYYILIIIITIITIIIIIAFVLLIFYPIIANSEQH